MRCNQYTTETLGECVASNVGIQPQQSASGEFSGCGFILGNYFFFYGFNWRWKRFRWGWAVPAEEVGLKKNSWRGVGGEGTAPPPQMHSQNMLRDSPSARRILGALCSHFLSVRGKTSCALRFILFVSCVHEGLGPLGSYFFGALGSLGP